MAKNSLQVKNNNTFPIVRSKVDDSWKCHDYREFLRKDFYYSCGYCTITEIEAAGISFHIDHYLPIKKYPEKENDYSNLMYSCQKCNGHKADFFPGENNIPIEYHIIRPDEENPREHYDLKDYELIEKTDLGRFNIKFLYLNRAALKRVRNLREKLWKSQNYIAYGITQLKAINIDNLPDDLKKALFKYKFDLLEQQKQSIQTIDKFLELFARSELIDPDPDNNKSIEARKKYLKEIKAIIP
jgi:hypothetical protein